MFYFYIKDSNFKNKKTKNVSKLISTFMLHFFDSNFLFWDSHG